MAPVALDSEAMWHPACMPRRCPDWRYTARPEAPLPDRDNWGVQSSLADGLTHASMLRSVRGKCSVLRMLRWFRQSSFQHSRQPRVRAPGRAQPRHNERWWFA